MNITMCRPVNITLSCTSLYIRFTTLLNRNARPVAPVKRVLINSALFVKFVSHLAHENKRLPPICSKNILPILYRTTKNIQTKKIISKILEIIT